MVSKLTISKSSIIHYFLIYLVIISQGSAWYCRDEDYFLILFIVIAGVYALRHISFLTNSRYMAFVYLLFFDLLSVCLLTSGSLSVFSVGNIISRFLLIYVAYNFDKNRFVERFVNAVVFFAGISLVVFVIQLINFDFLTNILPQYESTTTFYGGIFASVVKWHKTRNIGLATEPGRYQIYLISALFLLLFRNEQINYSVKKNMIYRIILVATIITAQSTTGFIALLIVFIGYFVTDLTNGQKNIDDYAERKVTRRTKAFIILVLGAGLICLVMTGEEGFLYKYFIGKLFNDAGQIDLYVSSGGSRIVSILTDLKMAIQHPLGMGYEAYQSQWLSSKVGFSTDTSSCVGLTSSCAALGFPAVILILYFYIRNGLKNSKSLLEFFIMMAILINTSLAQPHLYYPPMMIIFLVEADRRDKRMEVEAYEQYGG